MAICRHCGFPSVLRGVKFCPECGNPLSEASDDPAIWRTARRKVGKCVYCGHQPLDRRTKVCPACGVTTPAPGTMPRFITDGALTGFAGGAGCGVMLVVALGTPHWFTVLFWLLAGGFAGALSGTLFGAMLGVSSRDLSDK